MLSASKRLRPKQSIGRPLAIAAFVVLALPLNRAAADDKAQPNGPLHDSATVSPIAEKVDWLVDPTPFQSRVVADEHRHEIVLANGLARRVIQLAPNAATVDLQNLSSGEHLLRAISPEARVTIGGVEFRIGGLEGQPIGNYLKPEWFATLRDRRDAYHFVGWSAGPIEARLKWKKHVEWMGKDLPWPPPGKHVVMRYAPPVAPNSAASPRTDLPEVEVHYEIYDGLPLFSKWLVVKNRSSKTVRVTTFEADELRLFEAEARGGDIHGPGSERERPNIYVETDMAFGGRMYAAADNHAVKLAGDPEYSTHVNYSYSPPTLLTVAPRAFLLPGEPIMGPDQDVPSGGSFESFRTFELLLDSTDRERRTLAQRRMYRTIAPWTQENPLMFHKVQASPAAVRAAIDQAHDVGFEMVIMSFGSGFNLESRDRKYWAVYKRLADEGRAKGVALGGYSLLASRGAGDPKDNATGPCVYGTMPCLGSRWGQDYLANISAFMKFAGFQVFENDGSYPGDLCASHDHPGHHGLEDSQWVMWRAITDMYKHCRAEGIFLNVPDWYQLSGSNKCAMGYRESNWSLPRAEQVIIERQNIFDGTWSKTPSMGWMMVPLSQYQGGGAAATIEPLHEHLDHYDARFADLLGAGVQACYRGPQLFDTDPTRDLVRQWVQFYKTHREVLDADIIHLRRPSGQDWDGILHVNPQGAERGLAFFYNPLAVPIDRDIRVPLYYTGLSDKALVSVNGGEPTPITLDRHEIAEVHLKIPAGGYRWALFTAEKLR
ncbi:MAG TPA: hypothetical protein VHX65_04650 [Pirellulales bacterium]|jgi:hypothetical protein|nr:hypothetical protein [Pirellulales bacterium]